VACPLTGIIIAEAEQGVPETGEEGSSW